LYEWLPSIYKLLLRRGPKYAGRAIQDVYTKFAVDGTLPDAARVPEDVRPDSVTALQIGAASFSAVQSSVSLGSYAGQVRPVELEASWMKSSRRKEWTVNGPNCLREGDCLRAWRCLRNDGRKMDK
jgi:hypothetical protein